jgi:hypothetical protein
VNHQVTDSKSTAGTINTMENKWIAVSENKPPLEQEVLVSNGTKCLVAVLRKMPAGSFVFFETYLYQSLELATHWQPLPEPPTEK